MSLCLSGFLLLAGRAHHPVSCQNSHVQQIDLGVIVKIAAINAAAAGDIKPLICEQIQVFDAHFTIAAEVACGRRRYYKRQAVSGGIV